MTDEDEDQIKEQSNRVLSCQAIYDPHSSAFVLSDRLPRFGLTLSSSSPAVDFSAKYMCRLLQGKS